MSNKQSMYTNRIGTVLSYTLGRPIPILLGSIVAFAGLIGVDLVAHYTGFALSGSEGPILFLVGWLIGVLWDLLIGMVRRLR